MAEFENGLPPESGLSGHSIRGVADTATSYETDPSVGEGIEETVHHAVDLALEAFQETGGALSHAVASASDSAFESAANIGTNIATNPVAANAQSAFSWGGYFQALGILCILLALLWFAVWCIRRYGKFNFIPRPGALPKDALIMEAQMPLGPKKGLMVVRFLNRRLLLGVTEHQISLITEENASHERPANNFQGIMESMQHGSSHTDVDHSPS